MPSQSPSPTQHPKLSESVFLEHLKESSLLSSSTLLAVSGGVDSMVMASLYQACNLRFGIAHLNHGLRGLQADEDEAFVKSWAMERGIPFHSKKVDLKVLAQETGANIQSLGRDERYAFFDSLVEENGYESVATAHHQDDDLENIVFHALRGNSIRGLCGIPEKRANIIRPLLPFSRHQLLEFAQNNSIGWREDPSNAELKYRRNEIRHALLPALELRTPGIKESIYQHSLELRSSFAGLMPHIQRFWKQHTHWEGEALWIHKETLLAVQPTEIILAEMLRPYGIEAGLISEFMRLMNAQTGAVLRTQNYEFINDREHVIVRPLTEIEEVAFGVDGPEDLNWALTNYRAEWEQASGLNYKTDPRIHYLDADALNWPLELRHPKIGDRFRPLGMEGSVLLSDFFTQLKLSRPAKEQVWLLISDHKIAAILGHRIHHDFRITSNSQRVLKISPLS